MGTIKIFTQKSCTKCPQAKKVGSVLRDEGFTVLEFDVATSDGLAEATFYSVKALPTIILEDREENALADFRGEVPSPEQIKQIMAHV